MTTRGHVELVAFWNAKVCFRLAL